MFSRGTEQNDARLGVVPREHLLFPRVNLQQPDPITAMTRDGNVGVRRIVGFICPAELRSCGFNF